MYLFQVRLLSWHFGNRLDYGPRCLGLVLDQPRSWASTEIISINTELCLHQPWQLSPSWSEGGESKDVTISRDLAKGSSPPLPLTISGSWWWEGRRGSSTGCFPVIAISECPTWAQLAVGFLPQCVLWDSPGASSPLLKPALWLREGTLYHIFLQKRFALFPLKLKLLSGALSLIQFSQWLHEWRNLNLKICIPWVWLCKLTLGIPGKEF